jgi:hypothetical protein
MSKPTNWVDAIKYYSSFTIVIRSINRQGFIQTVKSGLWVAFHPQIELMLCWANRHVQIYAEFQDNEYFEIDEALYFPRTGTLWNREYGFFHPIINLQPHSFCKFLFQTSWIKVVLTLFLNDLVEYDRVQIGNHVHGPVYGHFVQHILTSHLALLSKVGKSTTLVTHPSQTRFIQSYNDSVSETPIEYISVNERLCKLKNIAIHPVMDVHDQKSYLDSIEWEDQEIDSSNSTGHIILRTSSFERRLHNRQEVLDLVQAYGIRILRPEENRMLENITKLRNSDIVIAPEGSGLIDCFFIDAPQVIMFIGLVHDTVFQEVIQASGGTCHMITSPQRHTDFIVNVQKLENALRNLGFVKL